MTFKMISAYTSDGIAAHQSFCAISVKHSHFKHRAILIPFQDDHTITANTRVPFRQSFDDLSGFILKNAHTKIEQWYDPNGPFGMEGLCKFLILRLEFECACLLKNGSSFIQEGDAKQKVINQFSNVSMLPVLILQDPGKDSGKISAPLICLSR